MRKSLHSDKRFFRSQVAARPGPQIPTSAGKAGSNEWIVLQTKIAVGSKAQTELPTLPRIRKWTMVLPFQKQAGRAIERRILHKRLENRDSIAAQTLRPWSDSKPFRYWV